MREYDADVDLSGLRCPLPVLRAKKALSQLRAGDVVRIRATDADAQNDIPAFVKLSGNRLIAQSQEDGAFLFFIEKR